MTKKEWRFHRRSRKRVQLVLRKVKMTKDQRIEIEQALMSIEQSVDFLVTHNHNPINYANNLICAAILLDITSIREQLSEVEKKS